jgi:DNA-binding CsgD family transcriptional regulator
MERSVQRDPGGGVDRQSEPADGLIVVNRSLRSIAWDCGAVAILRRADGHQPSGDSPLTLPPEIQNCFGAWLNEDPARPILRLVVGGEEYNCRIFLMESQTGNGAEPLFAIHLRRDVSMTEAIHRIAGAYGLTRREKEAVIGVSMGLTSKELATQMGISINTVNAFLRLIMVKMGVTTRAGVVGKLLEDNGATSEDQRPAVSRAAYD